MQIVRHPTRANGVNLGVCKYVFSDSHRGKPQKLTKNEHRNGEVRVLVPADPVKLAAYRKQKAELERKIKDSKSANSHFRR